jgi:hypothetical protein
MWRLTFLLLVGATLGCIVAWLLTGERGYRRWAIRCGQFGLAATLLIFALLVLERLAG